MVVQCLYKHLLFRELKALKAVKFYSLPEQWQPLVTNLVLRYMLGYVVLALMWQHKPCFGVGIGLQVGSCLLRHAVVTGWPVELGLAQAACQPGTV